MTSRDRRALFVGGVVVGCAVLALRVVPWAVRRGAGAYGELRERAALLARARDEIAAAPLLRDSASVLTRALVALAPQLLSGGTAAEANADLSGRLTLAVTRAPATLERLDALPDSAAAGRLARVRAHAAVETDARGLAQFLKTLETGGGDAVLTVEELHVVAPNPGSTDRQPEVLKVEVTVSGWYLVGRK